MKRNKYRNVKSEGYSSKKEHKRALELKLLEKAGIIRDLKEQVRFLLLAGFKDKSGVTERSIFYVSDFCYYDNEKKCEVVEDVKSPFTKKLSTYILKRKFFKAKYPDILFLET